MSSVLYRECGGEVWMRSKQGLSAGAFPIQHLELTRVARPMGIGSWCAGGEFAGRILGWANR